MRNWLLFKENCLDGDTRIAMIMKLIAQGLSDQDIADWYKIQDRWPHGEFSKKDVKVYRKAYEGKLSAGSIYTPPVETKVRAYNDYSIYPNIDYAIGFLTRGCIRNCPWCVVPRKEGKIRAYRSWRDIKRPDSKKIVFMDNNVLACEYGIEQMRDVVGEDVRIDFNQGLDARLITDDVAELLSKLKWIKFIRMSCDTDAMLNVVVNAINRLTANGVPAYRLFVYLLVQDVESAERRAIKLRDLGVNPFAQPYRDFTTNKEPDRELKRLARWVNHKAIFKSTERFADYRG